MLEEGVGAAVVVVAWERDVHRVVLQQSLSLLQALHDTVGNNACRQQLSHISVEVSAVGYGRRRGVVLVDRTEHTQQIEVEERA